MFQHGSERAHNLHKYTLTHVEMCMQYTYTHTQTFKAHIPAFLSPLKLPTDNSNFSLHSLVSPFHHSL